MAEKLVEVAIEGVDYVGKSSIAKILADNLIAQGRSVKVANTFHRANTINGDDIYHLWHIPGGAEKAIDALKSAIESVRDEAIEEGCDTVIYDRHWMTAFTEIGDNSELVSYWGEEYMPMTALLLDARPEEEQYDPTRTDAWETRAERQRYKALYSEVAHKNYPHLLGSYLISVLPHDFVRVARVIESDLVYRR